MVDGERTAAAAPVPLWAPWAAAQERTLEVPPALTARAAAGLRSPAAEVFFFFFFFGGGGGGGLRSRGEEGEKRRRELLLLLREQGNKK